MESGIIDFAKYLVGQEAITEAVTNVRKLKSATTALSKTIEDDTKRITTGYTAIKTALADLNGKTQGLNLGSGITEADRKLLHQYIAEVDALKASKLRLKETEAAQAAILKQTEGATKGLTSALRQQQNALKAAIAANDIESAKKYAAQLVDTRLKTEQLGKAVRGAVSEYTAVQGSYNNLNLATNKLKAELRALDTGFDSNSEHANKLRKEIVENTQKLSAFDAQINQSFRSVAQAPSLQAKIGQGVTGLAQSFAGAYIGIQGLATGLQQVFAANVAYSDSAVAVRKTTNMSAAEFERLADSLKGLDSRTPLSALLDIAKVGGQAGEVKDDILDFVKTVDIANQALGDDFGGGDEAAEKIATVLGKIANVYKKELTPEIAKNLLSIGSAVNELAAVGDATSPFLAQVALDVGAGAAAFGVGLKNVFAYAAVLEEAGFTADVTGSSLSRLFSTLGNKTKEAFEIAQRANPALTLKEFTRLVNSDFNSAIQLFLRGLTAGGVMTTKQSALLTTLKLSSGDTKNAILTLAQKTETFAQRQATANDQLRDANSLTAEAGKRNDTLAASYEKLKKDLSNLFTDGLFGQFFKDTIDTARSRLKLLTDGFDTLKTKAIEAGQAVANSDLGKKLGLDKIGQEAEEAGKKTADFTTETLNTAKALNKQAEEGKGLLAAYEKLEGQERELQANGKSTNGIQAERNRLLLKIRQVLGESAVAVNAETGAMRLNASATQAAILYKKQDIETIKARQKQAVASLSESIPQIEAQLIKAQQSFSKAQLGFDNFGLTPEQKEDIQAAAEEQLKLREGVLTKNTTARSTMAFPIVQVRAAEAYLTAQKNLTTQEEALAQAQKDRSIVQSALNALDKLTIQTAEDKKAGGDDGIGTDKEKAKAIADIAAEEFKLHKQRLEARITDYDRQAENPANTEQIRTQALQKAALDRIVLAELEQREGIRLAAQSNKEKIGGDKATAVTRTLLTEKFAADVLAINKKLSKDELVLRNLTLDQLAAVDKLMLDVEIEALDKLAGDERYSYAERHSAALNASTRRIELILIESDIKRRAAKGDLQELARIQAEEDKLTTAELSKSKPFDSAKFTDDIRKRYAVEGTLLEEQYGKRLLKERDYNKQIQTLDNNREKESIDALEREFGLTAEVLERRRALRQRIGEQELTEERRVAQARADLIQEGLQYAQQLGDAFFQIQRNQSDARLDMLQQAAERELKNAGDNDDKKYLEAKAKLDRQRAYELADLDYKLSHNLVQVGENEQKKAEIEERYRQDGIVLEASKNDLKSQIEVDYQKRIAKEKQKQAELERRGALYNIALNTAMGVASVLSTGGGTRYADFGISAGILSALVVAQGLAQAAVVLASPLPAYFKGRTNGPAEYAEVAERGPELIEGKQGFRLAAKRGIAYLEAGDKVHTAERTREILRVSEMGTSVPQAVTVSFDAGTSTLRSPSGLQVGKIDSSLLALLASNERIVKAIKQMPGFNLNISDDGIEKIIHQQSGSQMLVNKRLKMLGRIP